MHILSKTWSSFNNILFIYQHTVISQITKWLLYRESCCSWDWWWPFV